MRRIVTPNTRPLERTAQHRDNGGRAKSATASGKWSIFFFCIKIWIKCFFAFSIGVSASKGQRLFLFLRLEHRCATQLNNYNAALPQGKKGVAVPQPQTYEAQKHKKSYGRGYVEIQLQNEASCSNTRPCFSNVYMYEYPKSEVTQAQAMQCSGGALRQARVCLHPFSHATVARTQR